MKVRIFTIFILIISILAPAESFSEDNNKKKDQNPGFFQKVYHDMTTRFNYFFNAKLKLTETLQQIEDGHKDDYNQLLPVKKYGNKEKRSSSSAQMDEVIKKSSIAIQLHKISKWVDDCYLLIAKANFFKGENNASMDALNYIEKEFSSRIRNTNLVNTEFDKQLEVREKTRPKDAKGKPIKKDKDAIERENKQREREKERNQKERKDVAEKERKEKAKERDKTRKETAKERDQAKKEKEKTQKERQKERAKEAKERAKERKQKSSKNYNKDKAKAQKDRKKQSASDYNKAKKQAAKQRAKDAAKRKKSGGKVDEVYEALENRDKELAKEKEEKQKEAKEAKEEQERLDKEAKAEQKQLEKEAKEEKKRLEEEAKLEEEQAKEAEKLAKEEAEAAKEEAKKASDDVESDFRGKGSATGFGHKTVNQESLLWKAENYIDVEDYVAAKRILDQITDNSSFPKKLRGDYYALKAIYSIENEMWDEGVDALQNAIDNTKNKPTKARYHFILAQISQQQASYARASESFRKVLKNKPNYDMEFNARLKMAENLMLSDPSAKDRVVRQLKKMLKDDKNEDYLDKIHYSLAEVELAGGNVDAAIEQLKESAANSTTDANQKGLSFLKLAEIYFEQEDYRNSGAYYDSAMVSISKDHPEYDDLMKRKEVMVSLAGYLNTIHLEDSLQRIAKMDEKERNMVIDQVINDIQDKVNKELAAKENEEGVADFSNLDKESGVQKPGFNNMINASKDALEKNSFYFYNPMLKEKGFTSFKQKWGNRSLNDWWAIGTKGGQGGGGEEGFTPPTIATNVLQENAEQAQSLALTGALDRSFFVDQLPLDEASLQTSNDRIMESMYQSGSIYKESLDKPDEAISMFNDLMKRYADNPYDLETNYHLYLIYKDQKNQPSANKHKSYIMENYPDSDFAQMISNPNYAETVAKVDEAVNEYYEASYVLYTNAQYDEVLQRHGEVGDMFEVNPLKSKFDFLHALTVGQTADEADYISALENVANNHPSADVGIRSKEMLKLLKNRGKEIDNEDEMDAKEVKDAVESVYKPTSKSKHYFVIHFNFTNADINKLMSQVSDFNTTYFSLDKFKVSDRLLRKTNHLVLIEDFANADEVMKYYQVFQNEKDKLLSELNGLDYTYFAISKKNYSSFFKYKILDDYLSFFTKEYLKGE